MTGDEALTADLESKLGSRELAQRVKESLVRLRDGAGGEQLAEMARDLLDGRIDLQDVGRSSAYADPLTAAAHRYREWFDSLTAEERQSVLADAHVALARLDSEAPRSAPQ